MIDQDEKTSIFDRHRPRLFGIAYRMLGTREEAEDILQEAYIRWHTNDEPIEKPEAWLVTVVTRLSIDRLRKASFERETYIGPWLPEPLVIDPHRSPEDEAELASDLSMAFLVMLERLSPVERAAFLLHDVFDCDYPEIATAIGKSQAASRQIIHRARERVRRDKPRFEASEAERREMVRKFAAASYSNDQQVLVSLFADQVALTSDGGGKINAARKTVYGARRLARVFTLPVAKHRDRLAVRLVTINGEAGLLEYGDGMPFAVTTFRIEDGKITAVYRVMNPDKLKVFANFSASELEDPLSQTAEPVRLTH
jgi:RNA polymerase sigma-70 factor (ECF subfamily)